MPWFFAAIGYKATAQTDAPKPGDKKEVQEIIISKKGNKDSKLIVEFKDGKVILNGKPLVEFKDDEITVNNRKILRFNDNNMTFFGDNGKHFEMNFDKLGEEIERSFSFIESGPFLGVTSQNDAAGSKILEVTKESAAEKAGLQKDDIITKVGDKKIENPGDLSEVIASKKVGDEVKITYKRDGKEKNTKAVLQERKDSKIKSFSFTTPEGKLKSFTLPDKRVEGRMFDGNIEKFEFDAPDFYARGFSKARLGIKIQDTEEGNGVKVLEVEEESAAAKAGLKKGDIITAVGDAKVNNTDEARTQLSLHTQKSAYTIEAKRNGNPMKFDIKIPKKLKTANL